ncbi:hypothetical protein M4578_11210 [Salipiger sp. P9]|uniref:hypothetical protein n=1 Tax=Salipiger pentaromativorans TaxID=2943193 RepID=UPI0021586D48|nr:hypothetical protein [Salipiger pentaromativorans]MCR8548401.1 hypothetical protein [Salipiger pentaromativorans]
MKNLLLPMVALMIALLLETEGVSAQSAVQSPPPQMAEAGRWQVAVEGQATRGLRGAYLCQSDRFVGQYCFFAGCQAAAPLGLYVVTPSLAISGLRAATLVVDGRRIGPLDFTQVEGSEDVFAARLSGANASRYLQAMRSGSRFAFDFQEGSDAYSYAGELKGSSRAIAQAMEICPAVGALFDVDGVVDTVLEDACQGRGGSMDGAGVIQADLDRDGVADVIVDESFVTCEGPELWMRRPLSCGAQVCEFHIYMHRNGALVHTLTGQNSLGGIVEGALPGVRVVSHGGRTDVIRWTGSGFAPD